MSTAKDTTALRGHAFAFEIGGAVSATLEGELQLCRTGRFYREDQGVFKVTRKMLLAMRENAIERGVDIPVKYTHDGNVFAAGWVAPDSLSVRPWRNGFGLFGKARFTEEAAEQVRAGALRYISPEIVWADKRMSDSARGYAGEPIGPTLVGGALVLDPFFSMDPVKFARALRWATQRPMAQRNTMDHAKAMEALKGLLSGAGISEDKLDGLTAQIMLAMMAPEPPAPEAEAEPLPEEMAADAPAIDASLGKVAVAFGLKPDASAAEISAVAGSVVAQLATATKRLTALESDKAARDKAERESLFAEYSRDGKLRFSTPADARAVLDGPGGVTAFRAAFGRVPAVTASQAPAAPGALPNAASLSGDAAPASAVKGGAVADDAVKTYMAQHPKLTYRQAAAELSRAAAKSN
jgi:phage I-like protein